MSYNIAIDGPSGAGKSTLARAIAKKINFIYVDTGALYRAIGLFVRNNKISPNDSDSVINSLGSVKIAMKFKDGLQHVYLNDSDVTDDIRLHEVSEYASKISAIPQVREFLTDLQRSIAANNNVIMDGRDIGSIILPNAQLKIYLTASVADRAERRYRELKERGQTVDFDKVLRDVEERDRRDMTRDVSPLKIADNAIVVDTTGFTFEQSFDKLLSVIQDNMDNMKFEAAK